MFRMNTWLLAAVCMAVLVSACAASEERSGPGADGVPDVLVACASEQPDCEDILVEGDVPTGGDLPLAPSSEPNAGAHGGGISIAEAMAYEGSEPVAVHGYIVRTSDMAELCETLAESFPPQCGGASLILVNADLTDDLLLLEEGGVQWSRDSVVLVGTVEGNNLTVESTDSA